ncbi:hypothetical protein F5Y17DRAFT_202125 [Xylariaceae sp. FL0594]|nr:hypothetical protein F5Y17DRAFT_202125 [Xylariaceae sp. FL0594]
MNRLRTEIILGHYDKISEPLYTPSEPETPRAASGTGSSLPRAPVKVFPLPDFVDYLFEFLPFPFREPPVPSGKNRVRWKCKCGVRLYDDFTELESGSLKDLEAKLCATNSGDSPSGQQDTLIRSTRRSTSTRRSAFRNLRPMRDGSANNIPLPLYSDPRQASHSGSSHTDILHLLCCINSGETGTKLHQERIPSVSTDGELIMFLNQVYRTRRSIVSWLSLRHVSKLLLSRFELDFSCFVRVHPHITTCQPTDCVCLPPLDHVNGDEYRCRPAPAKRPKHVPVFGDNYLIHYFKHPQCLSEVQTTIFDQLPKRACGHLAASHDESVLGWGVYFEEGWHWRSIYFIVVVLIVTASLVFGVSWSILRADIQGAFAIAGYLMTLGSLLLGYMAVRSF